MHQLSPFGATIFQRTYQATPTETWDQCAARVARFVCADSARLEQRMRELIAAREFMPGGRYLYSSGRKNPQIGNCFLFRAGDSAVEWSELLANVFLASSKGGGCGTEYSDARPKDSPIKGYGGTSSGPVSVMHMVNDIGRFAKDGAKRRAALWAGLNWQHPDIQEFIYTKDWNDEIRRQKARNFDFKAPLDQTNVSVGLDDAFFASLDPEDPGNPAWKLYLETMHLALRTGDPGFSINLGPNAKRVLRNPCTEIDSEDNLDNCNLGHANMARIRNLNHFEEVVWKGTQFLFRGTLRGWLPAARFRAVRDRNRRLGLGLMGVHEWCIQRGYRYEPTPELGRWLDLWQEVSDAAAESVAKEFGLPVPIGRRAIAPTGTGAIVADTTASADPMVVKACKRRFQDGGVHKYQYIVDPAAHRAMEAGIPLDEIEDSHSLAHDIPRRLAMQAFLQERTDQCISNTINLPAWGTPGNDDATKMAVDVLPFLPKLRGITFYPDKAHSGQPIEPCSLEEAQANAGRTFIEQTENQCVNGVCGI